MIDFNGYTKEYIEDQMLDQVPNDLDKREGSIIQTALGPVAWYLEGLYMQLNQVQQNAFPSTAVGEVPEWGIVGHFNNWGNDLKMYMERNIFVYKGLTFENENDESINSNAIKIRLGGSWDNGGNIGTSGSDVDAVPGDAISVINNGGSKNIIVPKGTYDIWFDPDAMKVWVMDSGEIPSGY